MLSIAKSLYAIKFANSWSEVFLQGPGENYDLITAPLLICVMEYLPWDDDLRRKYEERPKSHLFSQFVCGH